MANNRLVEVVIRAKDATAAGINSARTRVQAFGKATGDTLKTAFGFLTFEAIKKGFEAITKNSPAAEQGVGRVAASLQHLAGRLGEAVFGNAAFQRVLDGLIDALDRMSGWVERNADAIGKVVAAFGRLIGLAIEGWHTLGVLGVQALYAAKIAWVGLTATVDEFGQRVRIALGQAIEGIYNFAAGSAPLLKRFGIDITDSITAPLLIAASTLIDDSENAIEQIRERAKQAKAELERDADRALIRAYTPGAASRPRATGGGTAPVTTSVAPAGGFGVRGADFGTAMPQLQPIELAVVPVIDIEAAEFAMTDLEQAFASAGEQLQASVGDIVGGAVTGGLGEAKDVALAALGQTFSAMGQAMITAGGGLKALFPALANPLSAGPALLATGALLAALGAALGKIAQAGARRSTANVGAQSGGGSRATSPDDFAGEARGKVTFILPNTPIDPLDPRFRRYFGEALEGITDGRDVEVVVGRRR